jgi:hypothetical protein
VLNSERRGEKVRFLQTFGRLIVQMTVVDDLDLAEALAAGRFGIAARLRQGEDCSQMYG